MAERHHELLRELLRRIDGQVQLEGLALEDAGILAEVVHAKNCLIRIGGASPFVAVFGKSPNMLSDFEAPGT